MIHPLKRRRPQELETAYNLEETFTRPRKIYFGNNFIDKKMMDIEQVTVRKRKRRPKKKRTRKNRRTGGYIGRFNGPLGNELKAIDANPANNNMATFNIHLLNGLGIGSAYNQRIGLNVRVKKINLRIRVGQGTTVAQSGAIFRILIVVDKQSNGVTMQNTDLLQSNELYQWNTLENKGRFAVLLDKFIAATGTPVYNTGAAALQFYLSEHFFKKTIRCNIPVCYAGTNNGDITDIKSNAIFLIVMTVNAGHGYYSRTRIRFDDE